MLNNRLNNKLKAYSLVEMLVTMAIFSMIITMLLQSLFLNIKLTNQINFRSKFNTDLDQIVSLIERDIRNADYYYPVDTGNFIKGCSSRNMEEADADCTISSNEINIKWYRDTTRNPNSVKRQKQAASGTSYTTDYTSTDLIYVTSLQFFINTSENLGPLAKYANILVTIKVKPAITKWTTEYGINEQVRQFSISTRNYEVKF